MFMHRYAKLICMTESLSESSATILSGLNKERSIKVLHVDDDLSFLKVAKQCLEMQGEFQVETACSADEAIEKMKERSYDAIVSDYQMPGKDGLQFLKELREKCNNIPFIIFTGKGREEVAVRALNLGADQYLNKNANPETVYAELSHSIKWVVERKKALEMRNICQQRYLSLAESAAVAICALDLMGRLDYFNNAFANLLGYSYKELAGRKFIDFLHPEDVATVVDAFRKLREQGTKSDNLEFRALRKDGHFLHLMAKPTKSEVDGKVVGSQVIIIDVTEREKAKALLVESEAKYRMLVEQSLQGIVIAQGTPPRLVFANPSMEKILGYTPDELTSLSPEETARIVHVEDRATFFKPFRDRLEGSQGQPHYEVRGVRKDGSIVWLQVSANRIEYNGQPAVQGTFLDITDRKKTDTAIKESEEKFRNIFDKANDGFVYLDLSGRILDLNEKALEIAGEKKEELLGKSFLELGLVSPENVQMLLDRLKNRVRGEAGPVFELEITKRNGEKGFVELDAALINKDGMPVNVLAIARDITERKKFEQQLKESEAKYRELFETSSDGIATSDMDGHFVDCNQACQRMFGYTLDEMKRLTYQQLTPEKWHKIEARIIQEEIKKKGFTAEYEKELIRKDGSVISVSNRAWATFDENGKPKAMWGIVRDITERKKADEELKSSQERLRILFESAPDAYYLNDLRGNFLDGNKAAEEITGYSKSELVGKSFLKLHLLLRSQIPKAAKLLTLNAMGKPTGPDEFILNRKDRNQVQVEIRTFPTKIQDQKLVLGIARDITERKKAEKLILESQQRFAALFSNNPEATVYTDPSMHILDINPRFTSLFGYSLDEVKGKHLNDIVVPDSHIEEARMLDSKTGEEYIYHDTVRKRKDGSLIPVSISAASISIQGQLAGIVGVYKDISEQTSSRKKLVAMNEKLRVVGGLTRHDVRNKLAAIVGNTYLVKKEMAGNEKVLDRLGEIEKAVQQSVKIFDFAKTYEMLGAEEMAYVDVGKTVKDAASLFTDLKGAKVINDCRGLDVFADSLLQQLFYNLIDNSLKYGQKMTTIRVHCEESGKSYLELVYEDDGVGIPVAGKTKLFTEGYSTGGSTGYGLYLIKKMVEVYGWTIKETGEPGKGARFLMTIPKTNESGKINYRLH